MRGEPLEIGSIIRTGRTDGDAAGPPPALGKITAATPQSTNILRTTLRIEGGAGGGLQGARYGGQRLTMRKLVAEGKVWAINGKAEGVGPRCRCSRSTRGARSTCCSRSEPMAAERASARPFWPRHRPPRPGVAARCLPRHGAAPSARADDAGLCRRQSRQMDARLKHSRTSEHRACHLVRGRVSEDLRRDVLPVRRFSRPPAAAHRAHPDRRLADGGPAAAACATLRRRARPSRRDAVAGRLGAAEDGAAPACPSVHGLSRASLRSRPRRRADRYADRDCGDLCREPGGGAGRGADGDQGAGNLRQEGVRGDRAVEHAGDRDGVPLDHPVRQFPDAAGRGRGDNRIPAGLWAAGLSPADVGRDPRV